MDIDHELLKSDKFECIEFTINKKNIDLEVEMYHLDGIFAGGCVSKPEVKKVNRCIELNNILLFDLLDYRMYVTMLLNEIQKEIIVETLKLSQAGRTITSVKSVNLKSTTRVCDFKSPNQKEFTQIILDIIRMTMKI